MIIPEKDHGGTVGNTRLSRVCLSWGQPTRLSILVYAEVRSLTRENAKKPPAVGLLDSVAMVVMLMHRNVTQAFAGGIFGCSQPTVSRRWDLLRPVIGKVLEPYVPGPVKIVGRRGTALVDGTVCPVWDWDAIPDLYSGKAKYTGMNVQIACNPKGDVAAIGPVPLHGAYAFGASGLKAILENSPAAGIQRGLQQDPCRGRARRGKGEDVADAQPGRRPLPLPD